MAGLYWAMKYLLISQKKTGFEMCPEARWLCSSRLAKTRT